MVTMIIGYVTNLDAFAFDGVVELKADIFHERNPASVKHSEIMEGSSGGVKKL